MKSTRNYRRRFTCIADSIRLFISSMKKRWSKDCIKKHFPEALELLRVRDNHQTEAKTSETEMSLDQGPSTSASI